MSDSSATGLVNLPISFPGARFTLLCLGQSAYAKIYGYNQSQYGFNFDREPNFYTWLAIGR